MRLPRDYLSSKGLDPSLIYDQIHSIVTGTIQYVQPTILDTTRSYSQSKCQFFHLARWDFVVDEDLHVHLIEVNDSPILNETPSSDAGLERQGDLVNGLLSLTGISGWAVEDEYVEDILPPREICQTNFCMHTCSDVSVSIVIIN